VHYAKRVLSVHMTDDTHQGHKHEDEHLLQRWKKPCQGEKSLESFITLGRSSRILKLFDEVPLKRKYTLGEKLSNSCTFNFPPTLIFPRGTPPGYVK
jgi:hypothetical protein